MTEISGKAVENLLKADSEDGSSHADPHPGNIRISAVR